jgi:putative membrane protein insertion efficiency factor
MKRALLLAIRAYRFALSPWWGNQCRFDPTCSEYALRAIDSRGVFTGSSLALRRLCKCHPWHRGGYDPLP